jgi:hypothetical protein
MIMVVAGLILIAAGLYAVVGLVCGLLFVARGVQRVDPAARGCPVVVRAMILPGCAALWPWVLRRWRRALRESRAA